MTNWLDGLGALGVGLTLLCGCSGDDGNSSTAPGGGGGQPATGGTAGATSGGNAPAAGGGRSATGGTAGIRATGGGSNPSECPAAAPNNNNPTSCSSLDLECRYANETCSCQGESNQSFVCWNTGAG